jgi:hypothetical protein
LVHALLVKRFGMVLLVLPTIPLLTFAMVLGVRIFLICTVGIVMVMAVLLFVVTVSNLSIYPLLLKNPVVGRVVSGIVVRGIGKLRVAMVGSIRRVGEGQIRPRVRTRIKNEITLSR